MDDGDDLDLLQKLLEVESSSASIPDPNGLKDADLPTNLDGQSKCSFESVLESLDKIPLNSTPTNKESQHGSMQNQTKAYSSTKKNSAIHTGDTDSSDDEDNRTHEHRYNEFGTSVKRMLDANEMRCSLDNYGKSAASSSWKSPAPPLSTNSTLCLPKKNQKSSCDVYSDPLIGIRIVNPLVSSTVIKERLSGRKVISFAHLKEFVSNSKQSEDWVIFGVIISKLPPKTSSKGSVYSIMKLSDLKGSGNLKTISVFLFSRAYKNHGKDSVGTVVGILNPGILDNSKNHNDEACLSVDNPDRIMIIGTSKDFGTCKSKKKNGENCTSIVNVAQCEYCVYHVKQEYMKCSRRSDIQSSFNNSGLVGLRNKVLGKHEVFYAGQSFTAVPAKKNKKLHDKDQRRLAVLSGKLVTSPISSACQGSTKKSTIAASVELSHQQGLKDADRLRKLILPDKTLCRSSQAISDFESSSTKEISISDARSVALSLIAKKKETGNSKENVKISSESSTISLHGESSCAGASSGANSREARTAMALQRKENQSSSMMPSALGLGSSASAKEGSSNVTPPKLKSKNFDEKRISPSSVKNCTQINVKKHAESKDFDPLSSKQLLHISSTGLNMESRLLKQAARKIAEQEENSKLNSKCTPSMLGLGQTSVREKSQVSPMLGRGHSSMSTIDLNAPLHRKMTPVLNRKSANARLNAINVIRKKGGVTQKDPNFREFESRKKIIKPSSNDKNSLKRPFTAAEHLSTHGAGSLMGAQDEEGNKTKMARFKELMEATSKHTDLIDSAEIEARDAYFAKLEKKEQLEEKMLNTFKVACKAVCCLVCKYTAFSASDYCKTERHALKVIDATKRFWKCGDCGNRTISLELIPLKSCTNCNSSRWEKAPMIRERKVGISQETLSVRGLEEKFIGSVATGGNINLLVPDES